ncbi:hypothetical protein ACFL27_11070 [candidate division CSSED10-310 bacterium]|uniref:Uncharacterized protein n=1 Tax=candidate division CSSED10-310 bacterium TaxID=2855610 RepID=A0ABV6YXB8_UNCC1
MILSEMLILQLSASILVLSLVSFFMFHLGRSKERKARMKPDVGEKLGKLSSKQRFRLVIEIVDPIDLAKRESSLARLTTDIVPTFITKEVYKKVRKEMIKVLKQRDIEADIRILTLPDCPRSREKLL